MSDPRVAALEDEIEGYKAEYASAPEARKDGLLAAITACRTNLHDLMQQQQQSGKHFIVLSLCLPHFI